MEPCCAHAQPTADTGLLAAWLQGAAVSGGPPRSSPWAPVDLRHLLLHLGGPLRPHRLDVVQAVPLQLLLPQQQGAAEQVQPLILHEAALCERMCALMRKRSSPGAYPGT